MAVKIVTDSTSDLPRELAEQLDIDVVPCNVIFRDEEFKDGIDIGPDEFYRRLVSSPRLPTTAQPSVHDFLQVYQRLTGEGHEVVSIHLSAKFSGTLNSATQAREALESGRVEVIDSQMTSCGLGLLTLFAARLAGTGASCEQVLEEVQAALPRTHCYFLLDTLEYLQKGGRIGRASAFVGSLLNIKPILTIRDGEAHPSERARTRERGLQRLAEIMRGLGPAKHLAIVHSTAPADAESLRDRLSDLLPAEEIVMSRFGPVVGTYLGPGVVGISIMSSA